MTNENMSLGEPAMFRPAGERLQSSPHQGSHAGEIPPLQRHWQLAKVAATATTLCLVITAFACMAKAGEANTSNDTFSGLRNYARSIDTGRRSSADAGQTANLRGKEPTDTTYAALRAFSE